MFIYVADKIIYLLIEFILVKLLKQMS